MKDYPIISEPNIYLDVNKATWRFEIRYSHSPKRPKCVRVNKAGMSSYENAKSIAILCQSILKRGGEVEWRHNCKSLSLDGLVDYLMCKKVDCTDNSSGVDCLTPTNTTFSVQVQCLSHQYSMTPCRLSTDFPPSAHTCVADIVDEVPMLLRICSKESSFVAVCNSISVTHTANLKEAVLTLDMLGFSMIWRILRDNFRWNWNFGPEGTGGDCYFRPGCDHRDTSLVDGLDKFLILGRDERHSLYGFLRAFGLTGQTVSRRYTEFSHGTDPFAELEYYVDIYEYPVHWVEMNTKPGSDQNRLYGR
jgi:hypothetical protein